MKKRASTEWVWWAAVLLLAIATGYFVVHCVPESASDFFQGERQ